MNNYEYNLYYIKTVDMVQAETSLNISKLITLI